ncbi:hypothetical protein Dimus_018273 [Dionaea muscipula]
MHTIARKEFYVNLTVFIYKKKEIAKSRVKGVEIEFDSMKLASILDVPGHTEEEAEEEEGNRVEFNWEVVIDEDIVEGNPDQMRSFMMLKWMWKNQNVRLHCSEVVAQDAIQRRKQRRSESTLVFIRSYSGIRDEQATS